MALSNPASNVMSLESEARASLRPASPIVSGFATYATMVPKVRTSAHSHHQRPSLSRQDNDFEAPQLQRVSVIEGGKEATTHDFLSLYGAKSASLCEITATRGLASSVTTQNFLQPLEKSSGLSFRGMETGANLTSQETSYALVNGTLDLPNVLYRVDRGDLVTSRIQGDTAQKLEGKADDSKESTSKSTPRSKHSAMEQRRRTKINDRFQVLRQLVPNADQKRDKASFLLEVIDYVKVLQEKARKYEVIEQNQQQERLKPILWDVCQRNPGSRETNADSSHTPSVPTVSLDTKKASNANCSMGPRPATREIETSQAELMSGMGQTVAISDRPAGNLRALHSISGNQTLLARTTALSSPAQTPAVSVIESSNCMPNVVPRGTPEPMAMFGHLHHHDEQTAMPFQGSAHTMLEVVAFPKLEKKVQTPPGISPNLSNLKCENSEKSLLKSKQGKLNEESDLLKYTSDQHSKAVGLCLKELEKENRRLARDVEAEQKCRVQEEEQADRKDALTVHGGVINVSSLYSQGLLDTLTRALQSSGLDLTRATISVQIDLGRPGTGAVASSPRKAKSPTRDTCNKPAASPELEHSAKRSKVEIDV